MRLPRLITGNRAAILCPYNVREAIGQSLMRILQGETRVLMLTVMLTGTITATKNPITDRFEWSKMPLGQYLFHVPLARKTRFLVLTTNCLLNFELTKINDVYSRYVRHRE